LALDLAQPKPVNNVRYDLNIEIRKSFAIILQRMLIHILTSGKSTKKPRNLA
jgi:hypothetical protein